MWLSGDFIEMHCDVLVVLAWVQPIWILRVLQISDRRLAVLKIAIAWGEGGSRSLTVRLMGGGIFYFDVREPHYFHCRRTTQITKQQTLQGRLQPFSVGSRQGMVPSGSTRMYRGETVQQWKEIKPNLSSTILIMPVCYIIIPSIQSLVPDKGMPTIFYGWWFLRWAENRFDKKKNW